MCVSNFEKQPRGRHLFSFVVVADTHVNEKEDASLSPFETNKLANARARYVFGQIAAMETPPLFIVHLGDIVHPLPSLPTYQDAVDQYKAIASRVTPPVYLVPGNHDIGEKVVDWVPADVICDKHVRTYRNAFGADYFSFIHGMVRGIVINAQLINSKLAAEKEQRVWLERELRESAQDRLFLFMHYPPYLHTPEERSIYDSLDQPGRGWLLDLVKKHKVEALFAGHVHNFWYDIFDGTEIYLLPSTAFLRHDFSEFYRVMPEQEFGRNDISKFGFGIVDVHEEGHVMRLVRTNGRTLGRDEVFQTRRPVAALNVKISPAQRVGVEMRHAWAEVAEIPSTGGIEEFGRKKARNDYPIMALWEMGVALMKVPDHDVTDEYVSHRMKVLRSVGHKFIVTVLNSPKSALIEALECRPHLVDALEINMSPMRLERDFLQLKELRAKTGVKIYWSKLRMQEDSHFDGTQFSHAVKGGFYLQELQGAVDFLKQLRGVIDGLVVRLDRGSDIISSIKALETFAESTGFDVLASVKLADANLAKTQNNSVDTARLAVEASLAAASTSGVTVVFDTFMDIDRGYHPRQGFIDRMFNPRPASIALSAMVDLIGPNRVSINCVQRNQGLSSISFEVSDRKHVICFTNDQTFAETSAHALGATTFLDLLTGDRRPLNDVCGDSEAMLILLSETGDEVISAKVS